MNPSRRTRSRITRAAVYERLIEYINGSDLPPDGRLVEEELAAHLSVSRTPVREALQRLEHEGLVVHTTGWFVRPPTPEAAQAVFEYRIAIEGYAARLASGRINLTQLSDLRALTDQMERTESRDRLNALNEDFHNQLTAASGNPRLVRARAEASIRYWAFRTPITFDPSALVAMNRQHKGIVEALEAGDGELVEVICRNHIQTTQDIVLAGLASLRRQWPDPAGH